MTEEFWRKHKANQDETPFQKNRVFKQTFQDMADLKGRKDPKALYVECLKNSAE